MGISLNQLAQLYPRLYHMAEVDTWKSIQEHGLLSTTALLDLHGVNGNLRFSIESQRRPESVRIESDIYGYAVIRDQKPMRENALRQCLIDLEPREWYELLNRKVFFWLTKERVLQLLSARAYRNSDHCVLELDTAQLLAKNGGRIRLSSINSGATLYDPVRRGIGTFLQPTDYPYDERKKLRGVSHAIAELTVEHSVTDIEELVWAVRRMRYGEVLETLYERDN